MGRLIDGRWEPGDVPASETGAFQRNASDFRDSIAPGSRFPPEPGRYVLYVSLACPWAHRTLIMRRLKRLEDAIDVAVVHWFMGDQGWAFTPGEGVVPDPIGNATHLHDIYTAAAPRFTGRVTVPVLRDRIAGAIVNNESAEILRILNSAFGGPGDFYPEPLRAQIDAVNARVYETLNNGVYKAGFARTQAAYDAAIGPLFDTLDWLETRLETQPWLVGERFTEADIRLFTTLVRFDTVYHGHFKCNRRRIVDYAALWDFTRSIYQHDGIAVTCDFGHIARHYYQSHAGVNPTRIVPIGPALDFSAPGSRQIPP